MSPRLFEEDCRVDTFTTGHTGSIRVVHIPTGFVETGSFGVGESRILLREKLMATLEERVNAAASR